MKKYRIALVEIGGSHDECLLNSNACNTQSRTRIGIDYHAKRCRQKPLISKYLDETVIVDIDTTKRKVLVREVWNTFKERKVEKVVLNTAQGKVIRDLCLKAIFHPMEFIGVIHTTRMFTESFTQKIIHRKIKKYFLLSEYLCSKVSPKGVGIDYFYPLRFPTENRMIEKRNKVVAIIGGVEERRKDLEGFIQMIQPLKGKNVRFVFLGKSDVSKPEVPGF